MDRRDLDAVIAQCPEHGVHLLREQHEIAGDRRLPPPVGWKLIAIAEPIAGGTTMPPSMIGSARGMPNW